MHTPRVEELILIAGKGDYPLQLAESARKQGVRRIVAIAFRRETERSLSRLVDSIHWIYLGQFGKMLDAIKECAIPHAVMAGQISPTHLFNVRMDRAMLALLGRLNERNAHTIFGAVADELKAIGVALLPAYQFMETAMPQAGILTRRVPTPAEEQDIRIGLAVAKLTSGIEIGQTVVIKEGTILAVEAFEGTDETIARAGRLGGRGSVVVKVAKQGHDMRFDIPVIGGRTIRSLRKAGASVLAVEAGRTILLEREQMLSEADRIGLSVVAVENPGPSMGT